MDFFKVTAYLIYLWHCYKHRWAAQSLVPLVCVVHRCSFRAMQSNVVASWRPSWRSGASVPSSLLSSPPTLHRINLSPFTKTWWRLCTSTRLMSFSCCSQRFAKGLRCGTCGGTWRTPKVFHWTGLSGPQFDLYQWLNEAHPVFSERTRLLELVHGALCVCGQDPEPEFQTPFHLFTKHWAWLLRHHFPDHYSDCLRLLMTSKCTPQSK